ncbi:glycosylphosphatidylinositol anchor biosynthesis [Conglomerata obtusa]
MLIIYLLTQILANNFALLINTSKDYENYRHASNIFLFYKLLKNNNYSDNNILYLITEDIVQDDRNIHKGRIYHSETEYTTLNKISTTVMNLNYILNILHCNHKKMFSLDENTNLFIYFCGHGGDGFLKILDREFLHRIDLMVGIKYLCKRLKNVIIFIDTCQAETIIDQENVPENCYIVCSSKKGEPSVSYRSNSEIGCAVIDSLPKIFYDKYIALENKNIYLEDFIKDFSFELLGSNIGFFGVTKKIKLNDFLVYENNETLMKFL